jgi:hypothetical protein
LEVSKILFVTDSGAGPPLARLYLIPKSFLGPMRDFRTACYLQDLGMEDTSSVVASSQKNSTSSLALSNDITSCRSAQDAMLPNQKLLNTICSTNLRNQLYNLGVPVSTITAND